MPHRFSAGPVTNSPAGLTIERILEEKICQAGEPALVRGYGAQLAPVLLLDEVSLFLRDSVFCGKFEPDSLRKAGKSIRG